MLNAQSSKLIERGMNMLLFSSRLLGVESSVLVERCVEMSRSTMLNANSSKFIERCVKMSLFSSRLLGAKSSVLIERCVKMSRDGVQCLTPNVAK